MDERAEVTHFLKEKPPYYVSAEAASGDSLGARQDEQKIRLRGRNQLRPAGPESVLRRRKQKPSLYK
jgi:hypothetical protein